ncbi:30S ribosomal protein S13 [Candidatus Woesearchaeota archaeon]|nr:30S ribosomal protein S13 [Candidatus Woesearchaeota archaeon]
MAEFREIIRIASVDMNGHKPVHHQLSRVKGVGSSFSSMVLKLANVPGKKKCGDLSDSEIKKIEGVIIDPAKNGAPSWIYNRRKDPDTGEDKHISGSDIRFVQGNDVKMMKKSKSYRGMRHAAGLPVRGQRTKSNFRKNKGKVTGVKKKGKGK